MPRTRVIPVDPEVPDPAVLEEAARVLREGGLVAFATETVYGLGADATNPHAVARIFEAKGRPSTNPLIVHATNKLGAIACVAGWPVRADVLAARFWPGPLTLVLPRSPFIPEIVTAGQGTVGVRVPCPESARRLILQTGRPLAAPSANRSTGISPTEARHVLKDLDGKIDLILDSGPTTIGIESTVIDLSGDHPRVLRPGNVTNEQIAQALGEPVETPSFSLDPAQPASSPGLSAIHYAPATPAYRLDRDEIPSGPIEGQFVIVVLGPIPGSWPSGQTSVCHLGDPADAESRLYATLHDLDARELDFIMIVPPPDEPAWRAVRDRIWRATRPWPG